MLTIMAMLLIIIAAADIACCLPDDDNNEDDDNFDNADQFGSDLLSAYKFLCSRSMAAKGFALAFVSVASLF